jgi:hypothetical protein
VNNPIEHLADRIADAVALEGQRVRAELAAGLSDTVNGLRVTAARPAKLNPNALNATSAGRLVGWSLRETSGGAPAVVTIYDGREAASADPIVTLPLLAGGGATQMPAATGVSFGDGLFVQVTGAVVGSLFFGAVDGDG